MIKLSFNLRLKMATPWIKDNDGRIVVAWILHQSKDVNGVGIIPNSELKEYR